MKHGKENGMSVLFLPPDERQRWGDDAQFELVRTGAPTDGNCFFHAMNIATKSFRDMGMQERRTWIEDQRRELARRMQRGTWWTTQRGQLALLQMSQMLRLLLCAAADPAHDLTTEIHEDNSFLRFVVDASAQWLPAVEKWIADHAPLQEIWSILFGAQEQQEELVRRWVDLCGADDLGFDVIQTQWQEVVRTESLAAMKGSGDVDRTVRQHVAACLAKAAAGLLALCEQQTFALLQRRVETFGEWTDVDMIMAMHHLLPYDVLFVQRDSRDVFADTGSWHDRDHIVTSRPVLVLLHFPNAHFENVGKMLPPDGDGKQRLVRVFAPDDPLVLALRAGDAGSS